MSGVAQRRRDDIAPRNRDGTQYVQTMADKQIEQSLSSMSNEWLLIVDQIGKIVGRQEGVKNRVCLSNERDSASSSLGFGLVCSRRDRSTFVGRNS